MVRALLIKELREAAALLAVALAAAVYVLTDLTGLDVFPLQEPGGGGYPFIGDVFSNRLWLVCGVLAVALGLKQTAWEETRGTYDFLLHRPVPRRVLFGVKLAFGLVSVLAVGGLTVLTYALWAAAPGSIPAPFRWSMTAPMWLTLAAFPLIYLSAFLSGIRPARWFGTRLVPLAAGGAFATAAGASVESWDFALFVLPATAVTAAAVIYFVENRDY
ncbi:MAG: hypothetical protein AAF532_05655 [Planctomycetota bacterium]